MDEERYAKVLKACQLEQKHLRNIAYVEREREPTLLSSYAGAPYLFPKELDASAHPEQPSPSAFEVLSSAQDRHGFAGLLEVIANGTLGSMQLC